MKSSCTNSRGGKNSHKREVFGLDAKGRLEELEHTIIICFYGCPDALDSAAFENNHNGGIIVMATGGWGPFSSPARTDSGLEW